MQESNSKCNVYLVTHGVVVKGVGRGRAYVSMDMYKTFFNLYTGCDPFPGTLNLRILDERHVRTLERILESIGPCIVYAPRDRRLGRIYVLEALLYGFMPALAVIPEKGVHDYPRTLEIVACDDLSGILEAMGGEVYLVLGCGLIRCLYSWRSSIFCIIRLSL